MKKLTKAEAEAKIKAVANANFDPKGYLSPVQKVVITGMAMKLLQELGLVEIGE